MNNKLKYVFMFAAGVAVGSVATWKYAKETYKKIAEEEIDSMRETFRELKQKLKNEFEDYIDGEAPNQEVDTEKKTEYDKYSKIYSSSNEKEKESEVENIMDKKPYVITPEEFDEFDEYEKVSLTYYSGDNVLAESISDDIIDEEDIDDVVGSDFATHFGEYEDDSVFVRNDKRQIDYEILMDEGSYRDLS